MPVTVPTPAAAARAVLPRGAAAALAALLCLVLAAETSPAVSRRHRTSPPTDRLAVSAWVPDHAVASETGTLVAAADLVDVVSPFWYGANDATVVTGYAGAGDPGVVARLRDAGLAVLPTVEDDMPPARLADVLGAKRTRRAHVATLVDLVTRHGYEGLDLDYEVMAGADPDLRATLRAGFAALAKDLAAALHRRGKLLSVTLLPTRAETPDSRAWVHDYAALGRVADRTPVMAYDYSGPGSPSGPVAPLPWVRACAEYARSRIPAAKVQLGVPLYGYDWSGPDHAATRVTQARALALLAETGAEPQWDPERASAHAAWTDDAGVSHQMWYPDLRAVAAKVDLAHGLGLGGVSFFAFGQEDPAFWGLLRERR